MKASVIIPTLNGGNLFLKVCQALSSQKFQESWEVVIIDSQSSDNSIHEAQKIFEKSKLPLKLITINKANFQHGKSRNQAIKNSRGEIILLLTQDAIPANNKWLNTMVESFTDNRIAGVFGRHIAHGNHSKLIQRDLDDHFNRMNKYPIRKIDDWNEYETNICLRQILHFFSNNNSALSKEVWKKIPFPEVDFGEDQIWAKKVIENDYFIAYQNKSVVLHSHQFNYKESCKRNLTELKYFENEFGYDLRYKKTKGAGKFFRKLIIDLIWLKKNNCFSCKELSYSFRNHLSNYLTFSK